ncbi:unnamed protein product [Allacma fusca]|uniref:Uncharacterized protein n=1 Tax=Allacma fusca TaxID=39272 RepID=A0A8J2Q5J5_9HEXA|nr:unnamed protein product [Allacma fusca]
MFGVKKSFLKPNPLSSTKVQTKSKVIIHKFKLEEDSAERSNKSPESTRNSSELPLEEKHHQQSPVNQARKTVVIKAGQK